MDGGRASVFRGMNFVHNQYLITRHKDTEHEHVHILANRITNTGKVVSDSKDYERQEALMRVIERDFGLLQLAPSAQAERRAPSRGEIEQHLRTGEASTRIRLQQLADVAAAGCSSYRAYQERLETVGVELIPVVQLEGAKLSGLMYRLDGVIMKGSDLGKGYSPAGLAKRGVSYEQGRDAEAVRRSFEREADRRAEGQRGDALGGQAAERRGSERAPEAAGAVPGHAERGRGAGPDRDRQHDSEDAGGLRGGARAGELEPERSDSEVGAGGRGFEEGRSGAKPEALRPGDSGRSGERGDLGAARDRDLGVAPAAERGADSGRQGAGRGAEAGPGSSLDLGLDAGREAKQRQVVLELQRLEGDRAKRLKEVLVKAERRTLRREEAMERLAVARPTPPQGLVATLRKKGHDEAIAAWEYAKALAWKLAREAKQLAERLSVIASPESVRRWAHALVARRWPEATARHDEKHAQEVAARAEAGAREAKRLAEQRIQSERDKAAQLDAQMRERAKSTAEAEERLRTESAAARVAQARREQARQERFAELLGAESKRRLTLQERHELVAGWDERIQGIQNGRLAAGEANGAVLTEAQRMRKVADWKLQAEVFRVMSPEQGSAAYPDLSGAYLLREAIEKKATADGLSDEALETIRARTTENITRAIERGHKVTVNIREQIEVRAAEPERVKTPKREQER